MWWRKRRVEGGRRVEIESGWKSLGGAVKESLVCLGSRVEILERAILMAGLMYVRYPLYRGQHTNQVD
jgi:hypothetical protein